MTDAYQAEFLHALLLLWHTGAWTLGTKRCAKLLSRALGDTAPPPRSGDSPLQGRHQSLSTASGPPLGPTCQVAMGRGLLDEKRGGIDYRSKLFTHGFPNAGTWRRGIRHWTSNSGPLCAISSVYRTVSGQLRRVERHK